MFEPNRQRPVFRIVTTPTEAEENLRLIRSAMERSTRHSTLSGLSGVFAGVLAWIACLATAAWVGPPSEPSSRLPFVLLWGATLASASLGDILLTKRRASRVGKTAFSPLGRQLLRAVAPGLLAGCAATLLYVRHPLEIGPFLYGLWMVAYATALLSIGMISVREVSWLGWAFLAAGTVTMLLPEASWVGPRAMMAIAFGGFHVVYGLWMGIKHGW